MLVDFYVDGMWRGEVEDHDTPEQAELIKEYGAFYHRITNGIYVNFSEHYIQPLHDTNRRSLQLHKWWILRDYGVFVHEDSYMGWFHQEDEYEIEGLYGVADTMEQVLVRYRKLLDNYGTSCLVSFHPLFRAKETQGGWRWHKNGPYRGIKTPLMEYLYDEPEIDRVVSYKIMFVSQFWHEYYDVQSKAQFNDVIEEVRKNDKIFLEFDPESE